ncbi:DUF4184 family protein [candidate division WOR-3 bacterium]|uniref:DUF4184 family protein n=1 Tax=candidate division WOR-3 bacterium TaxID=2052148 RepID=A0A9D5QDH4_UNCW3|nr:DUF4184 family protein [candidate division WOR-3 bacterium]MBD3364050.1 DUF4184 family protein [candidate division WOR-3 bacterium]
MPFTPYHAGPAMLAGVGFRKVFHIPALIVGSVIVDIEPFLVLAFDLDYPLHGFFHTFAGGTIAVLLISVPIWLLRKPIGKLMARLKLEQKKGFWFILWSAMFGMVTHIIMDSLFHADLRPFYPFWYNPFYGHISSKAIHFLCVFSFIAAGIIYIVIFFTAQKKESRQKNS